MERSDLESLLDQINTAQSRRAGGRRRRADQVELSRLRRLLAQAIARAADEDVEEEDPYEGWLDDSSWEHDEDWLDPAVEADPWPRQRRRFPRSNPVRVEGGVTAKSRRGPIGETWWSRRFLAAVELALVGGRSTRGRSYARHGQVLDLTVRAGAVAARVQGSRRSPYVVRISMPVAGDDEWERIVVALAGQAGYAASMLAGELPHEIEGVFADVGVALFPSPTSRLSTDCTCPDWANPCKHVAAACYLAAEAFDQDPFLLLAWRGRDRESVLGRLRELRGGMVDRRPPSPPAPSDSAPPLADCLLGFFKAGPELASARVRPEASTAPSAVLRQVRQGLIQVRARDLGDVLEPAYDQMAAAAERRALGSTRRTSDGGL